jgi:hypothetical protein
LTLPMILPDAAAWLGRDYPDAAPQ